ncbi:MAG: acyl-CoA dehydrogenase [Actinomycetia bacterium]|nr:acyl-CoA dehydrogenase [Actinomycetes bacterium]
MDFTLTEDQTLLRDTARNVLTKQCPPSLLRAHIEDPAAAAPLWEHLRAYAGLGGGAATDLCLFLEETGYVAAPGPFFASSALFAPVLAALGHGLLDDVQAGTTTGTVAIAGTKGEWLPNNDTTKTFVLEADRADHIAIIQGSGDVVLAPAAAAAERLRFVESVDTSRRVFELDAQGIEGERCSLAPDAIGRVLDIAYVALAAEMVGTARRIFDMAVAYAKERYQFDRPIGSFQAIQHKLADDALALERSTAAVHYAAMTVDAGDPERTRACHVAKAAAGDAARRALKDGIQVHGGIGYTWEHDLHLYLRRATGDEYLLGQTGWHHDRIADLLFA